MHSRCILNRALLSPLSCQDITCELLFIQTLIGHNSEKRIPYYDRYKQQSNIKMSLSQITLTLELKWTFMYVTTDSQYGCALTRIEMSTHRPPEYPP